MKSDLHNRWENSSTLHPPKDSATGEQMDVVRGLYQELGHEIISACPEGRELSVAITHLEDSLMWAIKAIACNQED